MIKVFAIVWEQSIVPAWEWMGQKWEEWWPVIKKALQTWWSYTKDGIKLLGDAVKFLIGGIIAGFAGMAQMAINLWPPLVPIPKLMKQLASMSPTKVVSGINDALSALDKLSFEQQKKDTVGGKIARIGQAVENLGNQGLSGKGLLNLREKRGFIEDAPLNEALGMGDVQMTEKIRERVSGAKSSAVDALSATQAAVGSKLLEAGNETNRLISELGNKIIAAMPSGKSTSIVIAEESNDTGNPAGLTDAAIV